MREGSFMNGYRCRVTWPFFSFRLRFLSSARKYLGSPCSVLTRFTMLLKLLVLYSSSPIRKYSLLT